ncbi:variable large family protein, partial [Borreliella bavariensis]|uniref:variable large family protein n=1 Tax=Borreliella bavariensis TaxID=664662 RepID=UPI00398B83AB
MKKDDQIAAAIVLRGMAKDGEFALKEDDHANHEKTVKNVVESAVKEISRWLEEMAKAAKDAATAATGGGETAVGNVIKAEAGKAAKGGDAESVNGIANGIKGIVDAAEKAGEEGKLSVGAVAGDTNADAGKLFAKKKDDGKGGGDAKDAGKAAAAVSAVSGEQILKAIVEAAKGDGKAVEAVEDVKDAKNPIEAAIGSTNENKAADAFATMKKDDQIAAAIVLRGMAKDGEFALKDADHANHEKTVKNVVESAVKEISGWLEEMAKAAKDAATAATGGGETAVGKVIKASDNAAKGGDEKSVNGIANGIKGIVDAAEKAGEEGKLSVVAAAGDGTNADAGKLFAKKKDNDGGGDAKDAGKAAAAVSAVSGEQILKAIVEAAGKGDGKAAVADVKDAKNPIEAAIGSTNEQNAGAFTENGMKKDDQIAAAIVLRGMAKDGEFALKNAAHANHEKTVKNVVESAVKEISRWLEEMAKAA